MKPGERWFQRLSGAGLFVALLAFSVTMLHTGKKETIQQELRAKGDKIIAKAVRYGEGVLERTGHRAMPFEGLSLHLLGTFKGVNEAGTEMTNENGVFTLCANEGDSTFTLTAKGSKGIELVWENVALGRIPEPEVR